MMTAAERVGTAMSHREPDRVPFFLGATMHGAKELGLPFLHVWIVGSEKVGMGLLGFFPECGLEDVRFEGQEERRRYRGVSAEQRPAGVQDVCVGSVEHGPGALLCRKAELPCRLLLPGRSRAIYSIGGRFVKKWLGGESARSPALCRLGRPAG